MIKVFNGKQYHLVASFRTKKEATREAKDWRRKGFNARVLERSLKGLIHRPFEVYARE